MTDVDNSARGARWRALIAARLVDAGQVNAEAVKRPRGSRTLSQRLSDATPATDIQGISGWSLRVAHRLRWNDAATELDEAQRMCALDHTEFGAAILPRVGRPTDALVLLDLATFSALLRASQRAEAAA